MKKNPKHWLKKNGGQILLHIVLIMLALIYIIPLLTLVSASFTDESVLTDPSAGFSILPRKFSLEAYKQVFANPKQILDAYKVTIIYSFAATLLTLLVQGMMAYPLSRPTFVLRNPINFLVFFTMIFSGGLVPSYIINTTLLNLGNKIWIYILPGLVSAWNLTIIRTSYRNVPQELIEAARLEGASEVYICFKIVIPLCKATLASVGFLFLVGKWNDWMTTSIYIRDMELYSLQFLLQRVLREAEYIESMISEGIMSNTAQKVPTESFRYAMAVVAAGPMLVVFPMFQKFFAKGMTIGSVKG